jgi:hypothetical protein
MVRSLARATVFFLCFDSFPIFSCFLRLMSLPMTAASSFPCSVRWRCCAVALWRFPGSADLPGRPQGKTRGSSSSSGVHCVSSARRCHLAATAANRRRRLSSLASWARPMLREAFCRPIAGSMARQVRRGSHCSKVLLRAGPIPRRAILQAMFLARTASSGPGAVPFLLGGGLI